MVTKGESNKRRERRYGEGEARREGGGCPLSRTRAVSQSSRHVPGLGTSCYTLQAALKFVATSLARFKTER